MAAQMETNARAKWGRPPSPGRHTLPYSVNVSMDSCGFWVDYKTGRFIFNATLV